MNNNEKKLKSLLTKIISDFEKLIKDYNRGYSETNYSLIFEEILFLKLTSLDGCLDDSYFNSIIEYFLNNDYKIRRIQ